MSESDLQDLAARAQAIDAAAASEAAPAPAPGEKPAEQEVPQNVRIAGELALVLSLAAGMASQVYPKLKAVWTDAVIHDVAEKGAAVAMKYGWRPGMLSKWDAEIMLAVSVFPLVAPTLAAIEFEKQKPDGKGADKKPALDDAARAPAPASAPGPGESQATEEDVLSRPLVVAS